MARMFVADPATQAVQKHAGRSIHAAGPVGPYGEKDIVLLDGMDG